MKKVKIKTVKYFSKKAKTYGYVGNAKNLYELGPKMMTTAGLQNQLELANEIIASAKMIKKACEKALKEPEGIL